MSRQHLPNGFQRCLLTSMQGRNIFSYLFDVKFLYSTNMGSLQKNAVEPGLKFQKRKEGTSYERRIVNRWKVIRIERDREGIKVQDK